MAMETDPSKINDYERQIEATILKQGEDYAARNQRSKTENKGRAESRARIKELGMDANAYATAVRLIKDKTPTERDAWLRDLQLTLRVLGSKQRELFPEEALKAEKRAQAKADKAASEPRSQAELDAATDANPKSDPKAGGAQVDLEEAIAAATVDAQPDIGSGTVTTQAAHDVDAAEQAEGDAALAAAAPQTTKLSQSARAQAARKAAGLH